MRDGHPFARPHSVGSQPRNMHLASPSRHIGGCRCTTPRYPSLSGGRMHRSNDYAKRAPRNRVRRILCVIGTVFLVVAAQPAGAATHSAAGCCQAVPLWAGALNSEVLTTDASIVTTDVPPGWYSDFSTPY